MNSNIQKINLILNLLGPLSNNIISHLTDEQIEKLREEKNQQTPVMTPEAIKEVIEEIFTFYAQNQHPEDETEANEQPSVEHLAEESTPKINEPETKNQPPVTEQNIEPESTAQPQRQSLPNSEFKENLIQKIAAERPQVIAFILSKVDDKTKQEILSKLPPQTASQALSKNVELVPAAQKIFEKIYQKIVAQPK